MHPTNSPSVLPTQGYIRKAGAFLNVAKQLEAQSGRNGSRLERFEEAMGVAQHHDAVAGTEKQHVAFDCKMGADSSVWTIL